MFQFKSSLKPTNYFDKSFLQFKSVCFDNAGREPIQQSGRYNGTLPWNVLHVNRRDITLNHGCLQDFWRENIHNSERFPKYEIGETPSHFRPREGGRSEWTFTKYPAADGSAVYDGYRYNKLANFDRTSHLFNCVNWKTNYHHQSLNLIIIYIRRNILRLKLMYKINHRYQP